MKLNIKNICGMCLNCGYVFTVMKKGYKHHCSHCDGYVFLDSTTTSGVGK